MHSPRKRDYSFTLLLQQIILDGNFIFAAIKFKIDIRDRIQKLLQGNEIKLYVLSSILQELETVGSKAQSALEFAKSCCEVINDEKVIGETAGDRLIKLIGWWVAAIISNTVLNLC